MPTSIWYYHFKKRLFTKQHRYSKNNVVSYWVTCRPIESNLIVPSCFLWRQREADFKNKVCDVFCLSFPVCPYFLIIFHHNWNLSLNWSSHCVLMWMQTGTVAMYLRQAWNDPRLRFESQGQSSRIRAYFWDKIWVPDIFFRHDLGSFIPETTVPNKVIFLNSTGDVLYDMK